MLAVDLRATESKGSRHRPDAGARTSARNAVQARERALLVPDPFPEVTRSMSDELLSVFDLVMADCDPTTQKQELEKGSWKRGLKQVACELHVALKEKSCGLREGCQNFSKNKRNEYPRLN